MTGDRGFHHGDHGEHGEEKSKESPPRRREGRGQNRMKARLLCLLGDLRDRLLQLFKGQSSIQWKDNT